eukprot:1912160-Rhodomonas_salina.3
MVLGLDSEPAIMIERRGAERAREREGVCVRRHLGPCPCIICVAISYRTINGLHQGLARVCSLPTSHRHARSGILRRGCHADSESPLSLIHGAS